MEDLTAELSNLKGEDDDSTAEETLSMKFPTFTKTKLLMIHRFIEEHNSSNLQSSSENDSTIWLLSSDSFNRLKLLRIEIQPFDLHSALWDKFFDNFECVIDQNLALSNIPKMTYLKILL